MDDEYVTNNNKQVEKGLAGIPEIFRTTYALDNKSSFEYRPIVKVTYAIEYQIFGRNPYVSHFINVLLYSSLVILIFYVLLRLLPDHHYIFHLTACLLFLIHPIHSEVVLSLKNRDVMLSFIGGLTALLFYLRFAENKGKINLIYGFIFLLFAYLSKKDVMTFFVLIPFTIWFFRKINLKQLGWIMFTFLPVLISFRLAAKAVINESARTLLLWENPLFVNNYSFFQRIPEAFYCLWFYLKMFLIPHPLLCYYGYNQAPIVGWDDYRVWLIIVLLILTAYLIFKKKALKELWVYGLIFFLITISMFTNVVKPVVGIVGERFEFIASLGLCITSAALLLKYFKIRLDEPLLKLKLISNRFWIFLFLIVVVYGARSFARSPAWKDTYTLYKADAANATESAHTHSLLASAAVSKVKNDKRLSKTQKRDLVLEAEHEYLESIRIIPDYIASHNNLGTVYYTYMNNPQKAIYHLEKAVELDKEYVEAYFNLGSSYAALKKFDKAEQAYLKAIELKPDFASSYLSLSNLYASQKKYDKIIEVNEKAISKGVKSDIMYINIGNVYYLNGDTLKAIPYLEKAISFNPNNKGVNTFLSDYYRRHGDVERSAKYSRLISSSSK
jgi:tetratricopeptide (TPR) repeat protein